MKLARLLPVREAAVILGVSERTFRGLLASGTIPRIRVGARAVRIDPRDLQAYIAKRREPGGHRAK